MIGPVEWTTLIWVCSLVASVGGGSWTLSWWLSSRLRKQEIEFDVKLRTFGEAVAEKFVKLDTQLVQQQLSSANRWSEASDRFASKQGVGEGLSRVTAGVSELKDRLVEELQGIRSDLKGIRQEVRDDLSSVGTRVAVLEQREMDAGRPIRR